MHDASMDVCCNYIEQAMEFPSDELLVKLVRIQQLAQSVSVSLAMDSANPQPMQVPLTVVARSFQQQIDSFKSGLSPNVCENRK
jgi:hypothetical protein